VVVANPFVGIMLRKEDVGLHKICINLGHDPLFFSLSKHYCNTMMVVCYDFCKINTHYKEHYRALSMLIERVENNVFMVKSM
jgi:hypothetical protein